MLFDEQFARNLDMIESVLVGTAACVAISVAMRWKEDYRARRRMETAEHLLIKLYEARGQIEAFRSQFEFTCKSRFFDEAEFDELSLDMLLSEVERWGGILGSSIKSVMAFEAPLKVLHTDDIEAYFQALTDSTSALLNQLNFIGWPRFGIVYKNAKNDIDPALLPKVRANAVASINSVLGSSVDGKLDGLVFNLLQSLGALEARCSEGLFDAATRTRKARQYSAGIDEALKRAIAKLNK